MKCPFLENLAVPFRVPFDALQFSLSFQTGSRSVIVVRMSVKIEALTSEMCICTCTERTAENREA